MKLGKQDGEEEWGKDRTQSAVRMKSKKVINEDKGKQNRGKLNQTSQGRPGCQSLTYNKEAKCERTQL